MSTKQHNFPYNQAASNTTIDKPLYISVSTYGSDWHSILHTHYFSELFYVVEGQGQFLIEDKLYPVSVNDLIIVKPNVLHTEVSIDGQPFKYIVLGIEGLDLTPNADHDEDILFCITNLHDIKDKVLFYLKQMLQEMEQKSPGYEILCQNFMENLVITLHRHPKFSTTLRPVTPTKSSRLCTTIRQYIEQHYKENITLDSLSELVHTSKYHIIHVFNEEYGTSPIKYLIKKRIEESCRLLETTDYSLSSISHMLGFSSPSYFSQAFKKELKCSPLEYRKAAQQTSGNIHSDNLT